jgi:hypothetical protein
VSSSHAIAIPPDALAAVRACLDVRKSVAAAPEVGAILQSAGPLTPAARRELEQARQWWLRQQALSQARVREITARLAGS